MFHLRCLGWEIQVEYYQRRLLEILVRLHRHRNHLLRQIDPSRLLHLHLQK